MIETSGGFHTATQKFASLTLTGRPGAAGAPEGFFSGYASVFGEVDLGKDVLAAGAFRQSLARRTAFGVRMLYQHDPNEPIGRWTTIREDGRGLYVEGVLAEGVARAAEVRALMKSGALDGLSIGFQTVRARRDARTGIRQILEADLWEISVVTFPMLPSARVATVKAARRPTRLAADAALAARLRDGARRLGRAAGHN